jgi:sulfoxide reductase catalytic subunit YedY
MFIRRRRGWEIAEREVTPESAMLGRRAMLGATAAALTVTASRSAGAWELFGGAPVKPVALLPLSAPRNAKYDAGRPLTPDSEATSYNNFYEFGESKSVADAAQALKVAPWTIELAGMVKSPRTIGYDDLLKRMSLEERVYRHRCVEAWAMTVPWIGFPLADLVKLAEPLGSATYVKFTTLADPKQMPGLHKPWYPWPYTEGLTMQEAMNDLAFLSVGLYGKTLPPQNGAPIRLNVPWKYGFKSAKSIVRVEFTDQQPMTFWEGLQASEYGFWANVNPAVPHPRWSQAEERLIGTDKVVPTEIWNGYGAFVAAMYSDKTKERLFA